MPPEFLNDLRIDSYTAGKRFVYILLVAAALSRQIGYRVQFVTDAFPAVRVHGLRSPGSRALPHIDRAARAFRNQSIGQATKESALSGIDSNAGWIRPLALQG